MDADRLLAQNVLDEDTSSYLRHASRAVKQGVARAHLLPFDLDGSILLEIFTHDGVGTMVVEDTLDELRPATVDDVVDAAVPADGPPAGTASSTAAPPGSRVPA